jgi:hypothetical protein
MSSTVRGWAILGALVVTLAGCGGASGGHRAPAHVEQELPLALSLANLCPDAETAPKMIRKLRLQARALLREARDHPSWLVPYVYYDDLGGDQRRLITIRQLAKEHLQAIEDEDPNCEPDLQRRLAVVTS